MKPRKTSTRLTDAKVRDLPYAPAGTYQCRDTQMPGLFVRVGIRSKTYTLQREINGKPFYRKIGEAAVMTVDEARDKARDVIKALQNGEDPFATQEKIDDLTLLSAWKRYEESLRERGRSENTIEQYDDAVRRVLKCWCETPLLHLGRDPMRVHAKHKELTAKNGPAAANAAMRAFSAIYNHAMKYTPDLPRNPAKAIDRNREDRRNDAMGKSDLPAWWMQLQALPNPIRREFHLLTLLSGSRPEALSVAKWAHLDVKRRVLHVPEPKGGERYAFDIPLSREMIRSLCRVRRAGRVMHPKHSETWIFPGGRGHMAAWAENRKTALSKWGRDLRQTYRTLAQEAGISESDSHLLMNHALPGVNGGYLTRGKLLDHLRAQQQKLSTFLMAHCRGT